MRDLHKEKIEDANNKYSNVRGIKIIKEIDYRGSQ